MARSITKQQTDWVDFTQLRRSIVQQNTHLNSCRNHDNFDPHKYFGGWDEKERSSIDIIKLDNRLKEMMDYETSNGSLLSKSFTNSVVSESLATPSVAEELEPTSPEPK